MSIRRLSLELDLDASTFTGSMREAGRVTLLFQNSVDTTARSVKNIERTVTGAGARIRDLTVTLAAARYAIENVKVFLFSWAGALVKASSEIERTSFLLRGLSKELTDVGRAKEAADNLAYIMTLAKNAPFSINALSNAFVKLKSGGIDPTNGSLKALVNAVAAFGGSEQQLDRASIAIQQMAGKGVVSMEELRQQLGEAVPSAMRLMAQGMGLSMSELNKKVSSGTVEAKNALGKMLTMMELTYGGSAQAMMETFSGRVSQAKTALIEFAMASTGLNKDGSTQAGSFFDTLKLSIQDFTLALQSPALKAFGVELGSSMNVGLNAVRAFISGVMRLNEIIPIVSTLKNAFLILAAAMTINLVRGAIAATITAFGATRIGLAGLSASTKLAAADFGVLTFAVRTAATANGQWAATAAIAATAARSMALAVGAALGPLSLLVMGVMAAGNAFGFFRNRVKEGQKALEDFNRTGVADQGTLDGLDGSIKAKQGLMRAVQAQIDNASKNGWSDDLIKSANARKAALEAEIKVLKERRSVANNAFQEDSGRSRGDSWTQQFNRSDAMKNLGEERRKAKQAYDAAYDSDKSKPADIAAAQKAYVEAQGKLDAKELAILDAQRARAERARNLNAKDTEAYKAHNQNLINLTAQRDQIAERGKQGKGLDQLTAPNVYVGGKGNAAAASGVNAVEAKIASMRAQAEGLRASIENDGAKGASEVAKMKSLLDPKFGDESLLKAIKSSAALKDQLLAAAEALDELKAKQDGLKAFNGLTEERDKQLQTVAGLRAELEAIFNKTEDTVQANARYSAGLQDNVNAAKAYSSEAEKVRDDAAKAQRTAQQLTAAVKATSDLSREVTSMRTQAADAFSEIYDGTGTANMAMLRYQKTMEKMVLSVLPEYRDEARKMAAEAVEAFGQVQAAQAAQDMREQTRQINRDLLTDRTEAQRQAMEEDVKAMYDRLNLETLNAEQRKKVEADYFAYVQALRQKAQNDNPMIKMARDWAGATDSMKAAGAGWMDSFVNQLAEGKLNMAEFTKSVLADVIKIIIKAMIANMILSAIGLATPVNAGSASSAPVSIGTSRVQTAHTGGLAGSSSLKTTSVPMSVFKDAVKLHTGGIAGLKSNEVPTILEKGEGVFTKDQMAAMGGRAQQTPNVSVNVINESGTKMEAQQGGTRFDGRNMILDVVIDAASKPGKMRDALKGASR